MHSALTVRIIIIEFNVKRHLTVLVRGYIDQFVIQSSFNVFHRCSRAIKSLHIMTESVTEQSDWNSK